MSVCSEIFIQNVSENGKKEKFTEYSYLVFSPIPVVFGSVVVLNFC